MDGKRERFQSKHKEIHFSLGFQRFKFICLCTICSIFSIALAAVDGVTGVAAVVLTSPSPSHPFKDSS